MTVTYTREVATYRFGLFFKLLFRWRGSIYKLVWLDLLVFLTIFSIVAVCYQFAMSEDSQRMFEAVATECQIFMNIVPLSFVLGFFVSLVMTRWWNQYMTIPWPDSTAVFVSAHIQGYDERARLMRRTIMRYVCLCQTLVFTMISPIIKRRFPNYQSLVDAGFMMESEKVIFERLDVPFPAYPKHWLPIVWAATIITRARKEGRIRDDYSVKAIIDELNSFRGSCGFLLYYDWINVPLVYTQTVTLAVYAYFVLSVLGHQWVSSGRVEIHIPFFAILQFFFYMGWLKVAETLINPFGEDDDDFELNWMVDRHLLVSYLIVDEMHYDHPLLLRDQYWEEVVPTEVGGGEHHFEPPEASTARILDKQRRGSLASHRMSTPGRSTQSIPVTPPTDVKSMDNLSAVLSSSTSSILQYFNRNTQTAEASLDAYLTESEKRFYQKIHEESERIIIEPGSLSFDELVEQRKRERIKRMQNRLKNVQTNQTVTAYMRRKSVTFATPDDIQSNKGETEKDKKKN